MRIIRDERDRLRAELERLGAELATVQLERDEALADLNSALSVARGANEVAASWKRSSDNAAMYAHKVEKERDVAMARADRYRRRAFAARRGSWCWKDTAHDEAAAANAARARIAELEAALREAGEMIHAVWCSSAEEHNSICEMLRALEAGEEKKT